jgi:hypothetical protein
MSVPRIVPAGSSSSTSCSTPRAACAPRSIAAASIGSVAWACAIGLIIFAAVGAAAPRAGLFG